MKTLNLKIPTDTGEYSYCCDYQSLDDIQKSIPSTWVGSVKESKNSNCTHV